MLTRVNSVLIGRDIARTAGLSFNQAGANDTCADGEIFLLDRDFQYIAAPFDMTDTDIIYVAQGTSETFVDGTGVTRRVVRVSAPIQGNHIKSVVESIFAADTPKVATLAGAGFVPIVGREYILRMVYKDVISEDTPGEFVQTWNHIATTNVAADLWTAFAALITADTSARVSAVAGANLVLTGVALSGQTLNDIDKHFLVDFETFLMESDGVLIYNPNVTITYTGPVFGVGTWQALRDMEKAAKGYEGITNMTHFPVPSRVTSWYTVQSETYDYIVIEHNAEYLSPDTLGYNKLEKLTTVIAIPHGAAQIADVKADLNSWGASTMKPFAI